VTAVLKFVHLAAIAVWSAGLIALPFLFVQRAKLQAGPELDRLHRVARLVYVELASPAAFIAIGSGTALIFLQATFEAWFSFKMLLVGLMAMLHVVAGLVLAKVFLPGGRFDRRSFTGLTSAYVLLTVGVIWVVLAKPHIDLNAVAAGLFKPGGLSRWAHHAFGETKMPTP
jgi:uncharacterized membrane protein